MQTPASETQRMDRKRSGFLVIASSAIVILVGLVMGLAVGFLVPIMLVIAFFGLVFYWALRHQGYRNPIAPLDVGPSDRYADGQPVERAFLHESEAEEISAESRRELDEDLARLRREEADREEFRRRANPRDFEGPPPVNPFP